MPHSEKRYDEDDITQVSTLVRISVFTGSGQYRAKAGS